MKKNTKNSLITKSELSLLIGGLTLLSSLYIMTEKSKNTTKVHSTIVSKTHNQENTSAFEKVTREPAKLKIKINKPKNTQASNLLTNLKQAEKCIITKECALPDSDPRSYNLAAYSQLANLINDNKSFIVNNWSSSLRDDFKRYLKYSDGYVKEAVLKTILELNNNELLDFTDELAINVIHDHNAELMDLTMEFIKRISDNKVKAQIENEWIQALITGSPNKSEALAKYSHHLLDQASLQKFKRALDRLPVGSPERVHLESTLREFEMTQTGG